MSQIYLINKTIIKEYEEFSNNIKDERILICVKKAQDLDLKPFFGHAFYYDFIKQFNEDGTIKDDADQKYKDLFEGAEYTDRQGNFIMYEGLQPTLVYFTWARFIENDAVQYTSTGPVTKLHDNAEAVKVNDIVKLVQQQRSVANAHANEVEKFLWDHRDQFPLWRHDERNKSARQSGPRIRGIDKTRYNAPGSYNPGSNYPFNNFID